MWAAVRRARACARASRRRASQLAASDRRSARGRAVCTSRGTSSARAATTPELSRSGRSSRNLSTASGPARDAICSTTSPPTAAGGGSISETQLLEGLLQPVEAACADEADRSRGQPQAPGDFGVGKGRILPEEQPHHLLAPVGEPGDGLSYELLALELGGDFRRQRRRKVVRVQPLDLTRVLLPLVLLPVIRLVGGHRHQPWPEGVDVAEAGELVKQLDAHGLEDVRGVVAARPVAQRHGEDEALVLVDEPGPGAVVPLEASDDERPVISALEGRHRGRRRARRRGGIPEPNEVAKRLTLARGRSTVGVPSAFTAMRRGDYPCFGPMARPCQPRSEERRV